MPRYSYKCDSCETCFLAMHPSDEVLEKCNICDSTGSLTKLLTKPTYVAKGRKNKKVGQLTEDFIDEARQDLKKQKQDLIKQK